MKKIRLLQILVYVVFALLLLQNVAGAMYEGAIEGYNAVDYTSNGKKIAQGQLLPAVILDNKLVTQNAGEKLQFNANYTLSNINVLADVRINNPAVKDAPWWFDVAKIIFVVLTCFVLYKIASIINTIIKSIYDNTMFDEYCIKLISATGGYIVAYSILDYAYQWLNYAEAKMLLVGPLQVVNATAFSFEALLLAIFVFIIAEAFKQGAKLKEEQNLTI